MILSESFSLDGPRELVSELLLDIESMRSCVPGIVDVKQISPSDYEGTLSVQVGPIKSAFLGSVTIDDSGSPERLKATARGKDRSTGSLATVEFDAQLTEATPNVTTVQTTANITIRGRLGGFGTGVIQQIAKQMVEDYASCVNSRLTSISKESSMEGRSRPIPILRTILAALWQRFRTSIRFGPGKRNRNR